MRCTFPSNDDRATLMPAQGRDPRADLGSRPCRGQSVRKAETITIIAVPRMIAIVAVAAAASALGVVALASSSANGLPAYTTGYATWPRINGKPFTRCGPPCAHSGLKNVYVSKRKVGTRYPNGTVVVKTVAHAGDKPSLPRQVAVMRKVDGRWRFVEYALSEGRYSVLGQGAFCQSCHARARANDYVFTKR
jgi:hypothetical protein